MYTDWLKHRAQISSSYPAVMDAQTKENWNYQELDERSDDLAAYLCEIGLKKGDRVALISPNDICYLDFLFACEKNGMIFVPINWRLSASEIKAIFEDCSPALIATTSVNKSIYGDMDSRKLIFIDSPSYKKIINQRQGTFAAEVISDSDTLAIVYTSGSTGRPKGVMISHGAVKHNGLNTIVSWNLKAGDATIISVPMYHTSGLFALTIPLLMIGGRVILQKKYDPDETMQLIEEEKCTIIFMVPTMYYSLIQAKSFTRTDLSSVESFISGGASCTESIYKAFANQGLPFKEAYGLTEAGPNNFYIAPAIAKFKVGSVGRPMMFNEARILNEEGKEAGLGEIGEIVLSGKHIFQGYWNKEEETNKVLKNGEVYTGDLGRLDQDGYFYIVGRKKDIIISGGENIIPSEVENILNQHPAVEDSTVVGINDEKWGEVVAAMVCCPLGQTITLEELQLFCRQKLGGFKLPRKILITNKLPINGCGKVDKGLIKQYFSTNQEKKKPAML